MADAVFQGEIAVIPCDTIYGVVASVYKPESVERLYAIRSRNIFKPCIILLPSIEFIREFISSETFEKYSFLFGSVWPGPVSVSIPVRPESWKYLHRGKNSLAFRVPKNKELRDFLNRSGPILAPSANKEGGEPARTIREARVIFGQEVSLYLDGGSLMGIPSTLLSLDEKGILIVREGEKNKDDIIRLTQNKYTVF